MFQQKRLTFGERRPRDARDFTEISWNHDIAGQMGRKRATQADDELVYEGMNLFDSPGSSLPQDLKRFERHDRFFIVRDEPGRVVDCRACCRHARAVQAVIGARMFWPGLARHHVTLRRAARQSVRVEFDLHELGREIAKMY